MVLPASASAQTNVPLPLANVGDLLAGNTYLNVHTVANPGGEIRGQVNFGSNPNTTAVAAGLGGADAFTVRDITPTEVEVVNIGAGVIVGRDHRRGGAHSRRGARPRCGVWPHCC